MNRHDSLYNLNTSLGRSGRDTSIDNAIATPQHLNRTALDILFTNAWPLRRACEEPARYALHPWGKITVGKKEEQFLVDAVRKKLGGNRVAVPNKLDAGLNAKFFFTKAQTYAEIYGGAGIILLIDDGNMGDFSQPVDTGNIKSVRALRLFDGFELSPYINTTNDGKFEPEYYHLGSSRIVDDKGKKIDGGVLVHHSRVLPFTGTPGLTEYQGDWLSNGWWGDSMIRQCLDATKQYLSSHQAIAHAVQSFEVTNVKIQGLLEKIESSEQYPKVLQQRVESILRAFALFGMLVTDKEEEEVSHTSRQFTGVDKAIERLENQLVAATNLPRFILFREYGSQLGQLGEHEQQDFDLLTGTIQSKVEDNLLTLITYILLSKEFASKGELPSSYDWQWTPPRELTSQQWADIKQTDMKTFTGYIESGVLTTEEVKRSVFGGNEYSSDINIDVEENSNNQLELPIPALEKKEDSKTFIPPKGVAIEAQKALRWREKYPDETKGGTQVGWTRANQLANREPVSLDTIDRMVSFFARHAGNQKVSEENKGKPWRDAGRVAWLLWGGDAGKRWAEKIARQNKTKTDAYEDLNKSQQKVLEETLSRVSAEGRYSPKTVALQTTPFTDGRQCSNCSFYPKDAPMNGKGGCAIVQGEIKSDYWCDRGIFPEKWVNHDDSVRNGLVTTLTQEGGWDKKRLDSLTLEEMRSLVASRW